MDSIKLKTKDNKIIKVNRSVLKFIRMIHEILECMGPSAGNTGTIPLKNVDSTVLKTILKWVEHHQKNQQEEGPESSETARDLSSFDHDFIIENDENLFEIINATNFLGVEPLFEMLCKHVAKELSNKGPDEIREEFGITEEKPKF